MPRQRKSELIQCVYFSWRLVKRNGVWYADGRSNTTNAGRHSLGVRTQQEARQLLPELDRIRAEELGLIERTASSPADKKVLSISEGRRLFEAHISRPRVMGGVKDLTKKKYRSAIDKLCEYLADRNITVVNRLKKEVLLEYASHLDSRGYAAKTIKTDLVTLQQMVNFLIQDRHVLGMQPIQLKFRKVESQPAYCYRLAEVRAMLTHCRSNKSLKWLSDLITALACTGLRISEIASLRWADTDFEKDRITLTDESGYATLSESEKRSVKSGRKRSFPMHPDLRKVLEGIPKNDRRVFHGPRGGQLKPDTVRRKFVEEVIIPLSVDFPTAEGEQGFRDGRFHSFRHYFCSTCANNGVPERMVMDWLGHADSEMIRHYYHLHDEDAKRRMDSLDFLGGANGRAVVEAETHTEEDVESPTPEAKDDEPKAD